MFYHATAKAKSKTNANGLLDFAFYSVGEIIVAADLMYGFSCKGLPYVSFPHTNSSSPDNVSSRQIQRVPNRELTKVVP